MKSVAQMIAQLEGLLGTKDLSEWEQGFVETLVKREGKNLSDKQVEIMERIYGKHFA
jgi:sulfur relay (sulfurtransferase) DsrC/TusE family protein